MAVVGYFQNEQGFAGFNISVFKDLNVILNGIQYTFEFLFHKGSILGL